MTDAALTALIGQVGFPIAVAVFLLLSMRYVLRKQSEDAAERERRLGERLDQVEDETKARLYDMNEKMTRVLARNTDALRDNNEVLRQFCDVVQTRPCLVGPQQENPSIITPYTRSPSQPILPTPPPRQPGTDGYPTTPT